MKRNFFLVGLILVLSVLVFYTTVMNLAPDGEQKIIQYGSFFVSLFLALASFWTFVFFFLSEIFSQRILGHRYFLVAIRRGILFSSFLISALVLQFFRLLSPFEAFLLALFFSLMEWVFLGKKQEEY